MRRMGRVQRGVNPRASLEFARIRYAGSSAERMYQAAIAEGMLIAIR
jgi:hypothetical protein